MENKEKAPQLTQDELERLEELLNERAGELLMKGHSSMYKRARALQSKVNQILVYRASLAAEDEKNGTSQLDVC